MPHSKNHGLNPSHPILRAIKYFLSRCRIVDIHSFFNIQTVKTRSSELLKKFARTKRHHDLITAELLEYAQSPFQSSIKYYVSMPRNPREQIPGFPYTHFLITPSSCFNCFLSIRVEKRESFCRLYFPYLIKIKLK